MIYSDLVTANGGNGIYTELYKNKTFSLPITNELVTADYLDKAFYFHNSQKTINQGLPDMGTASKIIIASYYDKWKTYIGAILNDNFKNGVGTVTETNTNGSTTATNKVSAYDNPEMVDDSGIQNDTNNSTTTKTTDIDKLNTLLSIYQKYSVYAMIETDIKRVLFSRVYYNENEG